METDGIELLPSLYLRGFLAWTEAGKAAACLWPPHPEPLLSLPQSHTGEVGWAQNSCQNLPQVHCPFFLHSWRTCASASPKPQSVHFAVYYILDLQRNQRMSFEMFFFLISNLLFLCLTKVGNFRQLHATWCPGIMSSGMFILFLAALWCIHFSWYYLCMCVYTFLYIYILYSLGTIRVNSGPD